MRRSFHPHRLYRTGAIAGALALVLVGCSDSDDGEEAAPATTSITSRTVDTIFTGEGSAEFCQFLTTFTTASVVPANATPAQLQANVEEGLQAIAEAETRAPEEIAGDVTTIGSAFRSVADAMSAAGYDPAAIDPGAVTVLQSDEFLDGFARLESYVSQFCEVGG